MNGNKPSERILWRKKLSQITNLYDYFLYLLFFALLFYLAYERTFILWTMGFSAYEVSLLGVGLSGLAIFNTILIGLVLYVVYEGVKRFLISNSYVFTISVSALYVEKGVFTKKRKRFALEKIATISFGSGFLYKQLGVTDLILEVEGEKETPNIKIPAIKNADKVAKLLLDGSKAAGGSAKLVLEKNDD